MVEKDGEGGDTCLSIGQWSALIPERNKLVVVNTQRVDEEKDVKVDILFSRILGAR